MNNLTWHPMAVTHDVRRRMNGYAPFVVWITGLSGSGKSSLASKIDETFTASGYKTIVLDGDNIRHGLNSNLGFSEADRTENIRRISEVARLTMDAGLIPIVSVISPLEHHRSLAKRIIGEQSFVEVYLDCPMQVCEARDPKGLYRKARQQSLTDFTGISSHYEIPMNPNLKVNTAELCIKDAAEYVLVYLMQHQLIMGATC